MKSLMKSMFFISFMLVAMFVVNAGQLPVPAEYFGFEPGADRMMFNYEEMMGYLEKLANASPRVKLEEIGRSPMDKPIYIVFISSEANIRNLDRLKQINRRLALDPAIPDAEREKLVAEGKVFVLGTLSMHSDEVGPSQAAPPVAYRLAAATDPQQRQRLDNAVYMMVPCHNPDGMNMVVAHYKKYKGTKYEGSTMPGLYHKYVGHDNNRDFVTLTQTDNRAVAAIYNLHWFPQVMVEKHQMGRSGIRYFVPPNHDPVAENIDAGIWNWSGLIGANVIKDMTAEGLAGVTQHYIFDDYWPGSTETCIWKNVIGLLTEAASTAYATPVFVEPNELRVFGKGLSEYKKSINMPLPWPGGWWRLGDIVRYEVASTMSILKTAATHRADILRFRNDLCRREVERGKTQPPYYYILPQRQHDRGEAQQLVNLMMEHGVRVYRLTADTTVRDTLHRSGDIVIPLAQSFRPFIKEVMEAQQYPVRHYTPGGKIIKPYDITSWSLPLHRGVTAIEADSLEGFPADFDKRLEEIRSPYAPGITAPATYHAALFTARNNESFKAAFMALKNGIPVRRLEKAARIGDSEFPAGSFILTPGPKDGDKMAACLKALVVPPTFLTEAVNAATRPLTMPRIALTETYEHDMDSGWTRFILESYGIPYTLVRPHEYNTMDLEKRFDLVLFPDAPPYELKEGIKAEENRYRGTYSPQFTRKMDKKGMGRLMAFLDGGGIIVSWRRSTGIFMGPREIPAKKGPAEKFELPVQDISEKLEKEGLFCPGSLMKMNLLPDHPLTLGMEPEVGVFFRGKPVFATRLPHFDMDRRVVGKFPEKDILMSGYCENPEKVGNKSAIVWLKKNKGQMVLFGFNPQFRASTQATYKLLFNALLLPKTDS